MSRSYTISVLAVAAVVRLAVLLAMPSGLDVDTDGYRRIAETLRTQGVFGVGANENVSRVTPVEPTAYRPPLYPVILSALVVDGELSPAAIGGLNFVLGLGTVGLTLFLAKQWGMGRPTAAIAALLVACDPILLHQSAQIMTETMATFLAVLSLLVLTRLRQVAVSSRTLLYGTFAGVFIGVSCLCRPTFLPWGMLVAATSLIPLRNFASRWSWPTGIVLGMALALLPWGIRNRLELGHFKFSTTHGGYTLLLGNNPNFYEFLSKSRWGEVWRSDELDSAWTRRDTIRNPDDDLFADNADQATIISRNEFEDDELAYGFAKRYIREQPGMFLLASLHRIGRLWNVLPQTYGEKDSRARTLMRWSAAVWYLALYGFASVGLWRLGKRLFVEPWLWGVLLCLSFTAVHAVYWSDMRMRAPLMPFICLVAGVGVQRTLCRTTNRP